MVLIRRTVFCLIVSCACLKVSALPIVCCSAHAESLPRQRSRLGLGICTEGPRSGVHPRLVRAAPLQECLALLHTGRVTTPVIESPLGGAFELHAERSLDPRLDEALVDQLLQCTSGGVAVAT